ncbi:dimethylarginine dimethylaminohydrolase family protein [Phenylobacterium aquaticum]|uniref:dimethylarginine dimethylaminohydrolase family protein n=1 Tax=Phenylobacterium aquaticum TaxID=1763816 RepID=UPI0026EAE749|nr:arginine deiminase-related protein [Phenylobacterium aquaticum]
MTPRFLMTDPAWFDVSYSINPWMRPDAWATHRKTEAIAASAALRRALESCGALVEMVPAVEGLPDLVFPANAAVVLDGRALLARFRHPERQGEEAPFRAAFERLADRGLISEIVELPAGLTHEGAGDGLWDETRQLFWTGHGPRSHRAASDVIGQVFGRPVVPLELATEAYYHLDTCFRPLSGGEVLYYPPAFTAAGLAAIEAHVAPADRIIATDEDAQAFCVNAVCLDRTVIMARAPERLAQRLTARGYALAEVDLDPFILSGGAAFCMTLRLDLASQPVLALQK